MSEAAGQGSERRDRRIAIALLAPVLLALLYSYPKLIAAPLHVPRDEDYLAARALLGAQSFSPRRDALALLPPWSLRPLVALGELEPISSDALAEQPLHRFARLFVVVEPDADAAVAALRARRGPPAFSQEVGRLRVERYDLAAPSVRFDFRARLDEATVTLAGAPCAQPARGGVSCGGEWWRRVTREWLLVSENGDDAIWAHPPPAGGKLEIAWDAVPMGELLVVRAGFTREGADQARAPVRLTIFADDQQIGRVLREPAFAFTTTEIDTRALAGRSARVRIVIDTDDNTGARFAFDAYSAGGTP